MNRVDVSCAGGAVDGWNCRVTVSDERRVVSDHDVRVAQADIDRIAPSSSDPTAIVEAAFAFLLEREGPESILRSFALREIGRYFPGYEADVRSRLRPD
jgi:hypothetical protein